MFLFDQIIGHCKLRDDRLIVSNINVSYGGQTSHMHDTQNTKIGPYEEQLSVGSIQTMTFADNEAGLFWIDKASRLADKCDASLDGYIEREKTRLKCL